MGDTRVVSSTPLDEGDINAKEPLDERIKREQHEQSIGLRRTYGLIVLVVTALQVLAINTLFVFEAIGEIGPGIPFHVSDDLFKTFIITVFATVAALGTVVTRSLFPGDGDGFWSNLFSAFKHKSP